MDIKPQDLSVRSFLESSFYQIPRFQRPYSWDRENVEDFWIDCIVTDDPDYFIGSFVVYVDPKDENLKYVVDGQQRLTTITLLFAALRDELKKLGDEKLARGVQLLIERSDLDNELRYILQSDTPYPYLQEHIQKFTEPELPAEIGVEEEALKAAFDYLSEKLTSLGESIRIDPTIAEGDKDKRVRDRLIEVRDRLLRLQLITVQLGNEDDAYIIFETLNTRGKNLTVGDLVKNHLTRLLRPKTKGVDVAKDKWIGIQELFDKADVDISVDNFLSHSWLSRRPYTSRKKLFKEIKRSVNRGNAGAFLDELVSDSELYRRLLEPRAYKWDREERRILEAIEALYLFRVAQPLPMVLALLRTYYDGELTKRQLEQALVSLENFHVLFTAVTAQRTGGGTAMMYAASARQLSEATDKNQRMRVIREFLAKLRERCPTTEEFEANFQEIYLAGKQTKQRAVVRYLLRRFDTSWRGRKAKPDYEELTIEHLAPESGGVGWDVSEESIGRLGNLLLVAPQLNDRLANRPFEEKLKLLEEDAVETGPVIRDATAWTDEQISERTDSLAKEAYEKIFRV